MSGALKSIGTIGGGLIGGLLGGPAGALVGGALGSSVSGVGNVKAGSVGAPLDASALAASRGFSGDIINNSGYSLVGNQLLNATPGYRTNLMSEYGQLFGHQGALSDTRQNSLLPMRGEIQALRGQIRPGFGRLSQARVQAIKDAGAESIGNMRESLARRNVLGSSFANDALSRQQMAIGQEVERASAEAIVQEIGMTLQSMGAELALSAEDRANLGQSAQLVAQRAAILGNQMDRELQELSVAGNIRNGVNAAVSAQAMQMAQLQMLQQTTNAGMGMQASMANAGNQSDLSGLMLAGSMGMFGKGGVMQGKSFGSLFG